MKDKRNRLFFARPLIYGNRNKAGKRMRKKLLGILLSGMVMAAFSGCGEAATEDAMQKEKDTEVVQEDAEPAAEEQQEKAEEEQQKEIELDTETKEELTKQLLEESELDTSVMEGSKATRGCNFTLPEGFEEAEDMEGMYVTKCYPIDASTIYYIEMNKDIALQLMTEETFLEQAQEQFVHNGEMDVEVSLDSFERIEIDGYPAFRIVCSYVLDEVKFTHLEYVINADKSYIITYSQTDEYDRMEEFEASAATITLEY